MPRHKKDEYFRKRQKEFMKLGLESEEAKVVNNIEPGEDLIKVLMTSSPESPEGQKALEDMVRVANDPQLTKDQKHNFFSKAKDILRQRPDFDPDAKLSDTEKNNANALLRAVEERCGVKSSITVEDSPLTLGEAQARGWKLIGDDDTVDLKDGMKFHVVKKDTKDARAQHAMAEMEVALKEFRAWMESAKPYKLQANECSRMHKMIDSVETGTSVLVSDHSGPIEGARDYADWKEVKTFVVKHDWCAAFGESLGAIGDTELFLPFPSTAFEFKLSNRVFITLVQSNPQTNAHTWMYFAEATNGVWLAFEDEPNSESPVFDVLRAQVKAICVMLDAKVAETDVVRQPIALNEKRRKTGKLPLYDYHIVDLSRRHRAARPLSGAPTGRHVRCHFRRGHWRHYEKHRAWINWMIVGDPDLGFVEKEYKL